MSNESNKTVKNDVFSSVEETVQEQIKSAENHSQTTKHLLQAYSKNTLKHFRTL